MTVTAMWRGAGGDRVVASRGHGGRSDTESVVRHAEERCKSRRIYRIALLVIVGGNSIFSTVVVCEADSEGARASPEKAVKVRLASGSTEVETDTRGESG